MALYEMPVDITWTGASGSPGAAVWHVRTTATVPGGPQERDELADFSTWLQEFYTGVAQLQPSGVTSRFQGQFIQVGVPNADRVVVSGITGWSVQSTGAGQYVPPANQMILQMKTARYGRSGRGRKFIGPIYRGVTQDNGTPTEAARAQLLSTANALIAHYDGAGNGAFIVYSQKLKLGFDWISAGVPNEFGVLRSRRD